MVYITVNGLKYGIIEGTLLKDALINNGLLSKDKLVCNGKGLCGNCSVGILREYDRDYVGVRSCITPVNCNMVVSLRDSNVYYNHLDEDIANISKLGLAVDIGTTTLSMVFIDLMTGIEKGRIIRDNPQHIYGSDVISRIDAYTRGEKLQTIIHNAISELIGNIFIDTMVISANTVMQHIFAGASLNGMVDFPMTADDNMRKLISNWGKGDKDITHFQNVKKIIILPYVGEYFGADSLLGIINADKVNNSNKPIILIDMGTNSEIAIITSDEIYCTSAAAGCALLGSYRGSDIVNTIGKMLELNMIDDTGRISEGKGNVTYNDITLTQADIRSYQLMKAAIATGIRILSDISNTNLLDVEDIYISGQFGEKSESDSMVRGGIIPNMGANVHMLGNSSLKGAIDYLLGNIKNEDISLYMERCMYYNMVNHNDFNDIFVDEINF